MPREENPFYNGQWDYVLGDEGGGSLEKVRAAVNESVDYLNFFVGATLDEPEISIVSNGTTITASVQKSGGGDIRYRIENETKILVCTPSPAEITLTPGLDTAEGQVVNYLYIDHSTGLLAVSNIGFPASSHSSLGEYYTRSASFHQTRGFLGKNHKNHVFTPGDNGHMEHINEARRKQPCVFESGLLLSHSGSGTATVNFALSSGQLYRMHRHQVSGISSPADFFVNNDETATDTIITNLNDITTFPDGSTNLNKYCVYILFIAHLDDVTGLFLSKPSGGYDIQAEALTDPDQTAKWDIPNAYIGASVYVSRLVARRTVSATTIYDNNTDIRGYNPGSVAGGGLSGVPSHGFSHTLDDPIQDATAIQNGLMTAEYAAKLDSIAEGADASGFLGNYTTAEINSLTGMIAGQWVNNTDLGHERWIYNGTFWLGPSDYVLNNRTGADSIASRACRVSASYDFSISNPGVNDSIFIIGTQKTSNIPDGSPMVVTLHGKPRKALMQADDNTVRGNILFVYANGECYSNAGGGNNTSGFGIALESKNDVSNPFEVWYVPIACEIY